MRSGACRGHIRNGGTNASDDTEHSIDENQMQSMSELQYMHTH